MLALITLMKFSPELELFIQNTSMHLVPFLLPATRTAANQLDCFVLILLPDNLLSTST
jgi:hypothetical protein